MKGKKPLRLTRADLIRKLREAEAHQIHNYHFSSVQLPDAGAPRYQGSSVIITVHGLGGKEIISPTAILDGLSKETIEALQADFRRSWEKATEFKPKGCT